MKGKRLWSVFVILAMLLAIMPAAPASAAASIHIGQYLEMGSYYGEPILWRFDKYTAHHTGQIVI